MPNPPYVPWSACTNVAFYDAAVSIADAGQRRRPQRIIYVYAYHSLNARAVGPAGAVCRVPAVWLATACTFQPTTCPSGGGFVANRAPSAGCQRGTTGCVRRALRPQLAT